MTKVYRTFLPLAALLMLAHPLPSFAQLPASDAANVGIAIEQVGVLNYPTLMLYNAIYSGEARIVISVDEKGNLTDHLVTGYTDEEFARVAAIAIKRWKYQPALVEGEPRASRAEVVFEFRDQGVIVQNLPGALERHALTSVFGTRYAYSVFQLRDLDQIPTPVHVVPPAVKSTEVEHAVTVGFYIDEEGRVRIPAVHRASANDHFAAAAVAAVEQWRFSPPLRKGYPVLVYAQQDFKFRAKP